MAQILLIEDDEQIRRLLRETLESQGHTIFESRNGCEGIDLFRSHPMDLVICDLIMPQKGGIQTILELEADCPSVKVITMSGFCEELGKNALEYTKELGALATVSKPFQLSEMVQAVENLLPLVS